LKVLILEPYYGGSHKTFLKGIQTHVPFDFTLLTLPARKWKWRMRLAAPYFADKIISLREKEKIDVIFCSSFVDVATLRALLPHPIGQLPFYTYFHENQFAYPVQKEDERDFHFGLTNLTTFMASDRVAFNSLYNLDTFIEGVDKLLKICPDMKFDHLSNQLQSKAVILHPGIDLSDFPEPDTCKSSSVKPSVIVWNHRWEHDKNPEYFFETLYELDKQKNDFRLVVMGQSFQRQPAVFAEAQLELAHRIDHFGYVESREEYIRQLCRADIVISTATHEFYGISVIEAVRAGCYPLMPARLSYPELFPAEYLYEDGELFSRIKALLKDPGRIDKAQAKTLTECYSWPVLREKYLEWFGESLQDT
jgi:glycosyltransferase involved in cell wall biosynthesis